jgi:hypothetical protein
MSPAAESTAIGPAFEGATTGDAEGGPAGSGATGLFDRAQPAAVSASAAAAKRTVRFARGIVDGDDDHVSARASGARGIRFVIDPPPTTSQETFQWGLANLF